MYINKEFTELLVKVYLSLENVFKDKETDKKLALKVLGLKDEHEMERFKNNIADIIFKERGACKPIYNASEEDVVNAFLKIGWRDVGWRDDWECHDVCGCCFTHNPAGFYGIPPTGGDQKLITGRIIMRLLRHNSNSY